jgi:hypothetical protein
MQKLAPLYNSINIQTRVLLEEAVEILVLAQEINKHQQQV